MKLVKQVERFGEIDGTEFGILVSGSRNYLEDSLNFATFVSSKVVKKKCRLYAAAPFSEVTIKDGLLKKPNNKSWVILLVDKLTIKCSSHSSLTFWKINKYFPELLFFCHLSRLLYKTKVHDSLSVCRNLKMCAFCKHKKKKNVYREWHKSEDLKVSSGFNRVVGFTKKEWIKYMNNNTKKYRHQTCCESYPKPDQNNKVKNIMN